MFPRRKGSFSPRQRESRYFSGTCLRASEKANSCLLGELSREGLLSVLLSGSRVRSTGAGLRHTAGLRAGDVCRSAVLLFAVSFGTDCWNDGFETLAPAVGPPSGATFSARSARGNGAVGDTPGRPGPSRMKTETGLLLLELNGDGARKAVDTP
jgi:hypothetical protein